MSSVTPPRRRARGSALLEVMFACGVLIAGVTGVVSGIPTVLKLIGNIRDLGSADRVCAATVEQLVMTWAADPTRVTTSGALRTDAAGRRDVAGEYAVTWTLTPDHPIAGYSLLKVVTAWDTVDGITHRRTLRTYVTGVPAP